VLGSHAIPSAPLRSNPRYLLALAVRCRGRFVAFDVRVNGAAVRGAQAKHLVALG
jgi:hypothetical protein